MEPHYSETDTQWQKCDPLSSAFMIQPEVVTKLPTTFELGKHFQNLNGMTSLTF